MNTYIHTRHSAKKAGTVPNEAYQATTIMLCIINKFYSFDK